MTARSGTRAHLLSGPVMLRTVAGRQFGAPDRRAFADHCCRRGVIGMGMPYVVAPTPMPPSQVLGGCVPRRGWRDARPPRTCSRAGPPSSRHHWVRRSARKFRWISAAKRRSCCTRAHAAALGDVEPGGELGGRKRRDRRAYWGLPSMCSFQLAIALSAEAAWPAPSRWRSRAPVSSVRSQSPVALRPMSISQRSPAARSMVSRARVVVAGGVVRDAHRDTHR